MELCAVYIGGVMVKSRVICVEVCHKVNGNVVVVKYVVEVSVRNLCVWA